MELSICQWQYSLDSHQEDICGGVFFSKVARITKKDFCNSAFLGIVRIWVFCRRPITAQKMKFSTYYIFSKMWPKPQDTADLVTFTE